MEIEAFVQELAPNIPMLLPERSFQLMGSACPQGEQR